MNDTNDLRDLKIEDIRYCDECGKMYRAETQCSICKNCFKCCEADGFCKFSQVPQNKSQVTLTALNDGGNWKPRWKNRKQKRK